jgi:hypothetical protein
MERKRSRSFLSWGWQPRWATAVIAVLIFVLVSGSTVAAAGGSMPDGPLYPVKLATEKVRLALTPSALGKAELYAKLADKRVTEIIKMADKGKLEQVERATERLNSQLMAMATLVSPERGGEVLTLTAPPEEAQKAAAPPVTEEPGEEGPNLLMAPALPVTEELPEKKTEVQIVVPAPLSPRQAPDLAPAVQAPSPEQAESEAKGMKVDRRAKLRMIVIRNVAKHREELRAALERAPESARPALRRALAASNAEYEKVLEVLGEEEHDGADGEDKD